MNPSSLYRKAEVDAANGIRLVVVAYDGAIAFLERARQAIDEGHAADATAHVLRAQRVVLQLMLALDLETGDVARNLHRLYAFVLRRLAEAAPARDRLALADGLHVLKGLRSAWASVERPDGAAPSPDGVERVSVVR